MKKGFTLVELLTIIVVLGIIALIAVPTITNIVDTAKKESFEKSVRNVVKAIEYKCHEEKIDRINPTKTYTFTEDGVEPEVNVKGKLPTEGTITVNGKCETVVDVSNGKYVVNNIPEATDESCFDYDTYDAYQVDDSRINSCVEYLTNVYISQQGDESIVGELDDIDYDSDDFDIVRSECLVLVEMIPLIYVGHEEVLIPQFEEIMAGLIETGYIRKTNVTAITNYKCGNNIKEDTDEEGKPIADDSGTIVDVVVPKTIDGNTIDAIGAFAFSPLLNEDFDENNKVGINSIILPDTITLIDIGAFDYNVLTNVTIGNSVKTISTGAFTGNRLTSLTLGNSVETISAFAFAYNELTSVRIPNSVETIGAVAFGNNQLTSLILPDSVTYIGEYAFAWNSLTSLTIPNSTTYIGYGAFNVNKLSPSKAFIYKRNEDGSINDSVLVSYGGKSKNNVVIPNSITTIGKDAFAGSELTSVTIPNSVVTIGNEAFYDNNLTSVTIPNSVTTIKDSAFAGNDLTSVTIGNGVTSIGKNAFRSWVLDNQNLTIINNNTGRSFDWNDITSRGNSNSCQFVTGTCGQITIN